VLLELALVSPAGLAASPLVLPAVLVKALHHSFRRKPRQEWPVCHRMGRLFLLLAPLI